MPSFPITVLRVACRFTEDDCFRLWLADRERYQYTACGFDQIAGPVVSEVARVVLLEAEVGLKGLADVKARWPAAAIAILIEPQQEPEMPAWLAQGASDYLIKPHLSALRLSYTVQQLATQADVQTLAATLQENQQALREAVQQQRLLTLLKLSSDHISLMDPNGRVLWHNRQSQAMPEPDPGVPNIPLPLANCYPPDTVEKLQTEGLPTALREGLWMGESWFFDSEQNIIPVSQLIIAHRSASGEVEYLSSVMRDISDLRAAEKALQTINHELERQVERRTIESERARKAAEAANQAKSLFLVNMGHELRTPLNAILGFSQMIAAEPSLTPRQVEEISIINRSGEHLLTLINEIIDLSKLEAGRTPFTPAPFNLRCLLDGLVDRLQVKAEAKGLSFILHHDPDLPTNLVADAAKLRQVLMNLVSHAIKLTQAGGIKLRVALRQHQLLCEVEDTGSGIDPEDLDQLFEPFNQISQSQVTQAGAGLGLPICQQLVRLMGGELWVNSKPGVGSIFAFSLPVGFVSDEPMPRSDGYRRVVGLAAGQKTYRILVVEDSWTNRSLLQNLLEPLGFQLQMAANGQDAVAIWANWHPHLVWMDLRMPVMDGYEATRCIRAMEQQQTNTSPDPGMAALYATKIIALTASASEDEHLNALAAGCNDFMPKPLQTDTILQKIAEHLSVAYAYEDALTTSPPLATLDAHKRRNVNLAAVLHDDSLRTMPIDWQHRLYQATINLNAEHILELIDAIPEEQAPLAEALRVRVQEFDFEVILNLVQGAINANDRA